MCGHVEVLDDPALGGQLVEARRRPLHAAGHRDVVGDRQQQRPGLGVGVARAAAPPPPPGWVGRGGPGRRTSSGTRRPRTRTALGSASAWASMVACGRRTPTRSTTRPTPPRWPPTPRRWPTPWSAALPGWVRAGGRRPVPGVARRRASRRGRGGRPGRRRRPRSPTSRRPLRALLAQDVDEQRTNPLAIVRRAVVPPDRGAPRRGRPAGRARRRTPSGSSPTTTTTSRPATLRRPRPRRCTNPASCGVPPRRT